MIFRKIRKTDLKVSVVGLGTWAMGNDFWGAVDDQVSIRTIQTAMDAGINLIDTAPAYGAGHAEEVVGKAIAGRRDKVVIATKAGVIRTKDAFIRTLKPDSLYKEIDASLSRLGVDYIDLYQIHWPDPDTPLADTIEALVKIKEQGKFKYLGVSNFPVELMEEASALTEIVSLQPHYSLLRREIEDDVIPYCIANNLGILSYGTLAGGLLTGKFREIPHFPEGDNRSRFYKYYKPEIWGALQSFLDTLRAIAEERRVSVAQVVINWTLQQPGITSVLVGAKNADQVLANVKGAEPIVEASDVDRIERSYQEHLESILEK